MLSGYRTLAATAGILGVSETRVEELIDHGPLVARRFEDGTRLIHNDDLVEFRRPHPLRAFLASDSSETERYVNYSNRVLSGPCGVAAVGHVDTGHGRAVGRATASTKSFRALLDRAAIAEASERFDEKWTGEPNTGCHLWTASATRDGYGGFKVANVGVMAHRYAWAREYGQLPERLDVDHKCGQRSCVNPRHLQAVTHRKNLETRKHEPARAALAFKRLALVSE